MGKDALERTTHPLVGEKNEQVNLSLMNTVSILTTCCCDSLSKLMICTV
jgi:hypothetical protein